MPNKPELVPPGSPLDDTVQERPRSVERNTRASLPPPVAIHAFDEPCTVSCVLLAANAASFGSTGGMFAGAVRVQLDPPSSVVRITSFPPTGSLNVKPCRASQNARPSRKIPLVVSLHVSDQCFPPSIVR